MGAQSEAVRQPEAAEQAAGGASEGSGKGDRPSDEDEPRPTI
jgi:hypothetical protein